MGGGGAGPGSRGSSSVEHSPLSAHSTDVGDGEMADVEDNTGPTPLPPHDESGNIDDDDGSVVVRNAWCNARWLQSRNPQCMI